VYTFETWKLIEEERYENENQKVKDQAIKEEDFIPTRNAVRDLKRSVGQITSIQQSLIHRMILHAEVGEHAHDKLTHTSIIMTLLFILSTVFQFYIIQRWFTKSTTPLLGR
jgi:emp24/gp25L/p24 family/GOLD